MTRTIKLKVEARGDSVVVTTYRAMARGRRAIKHVELMPRGSLHKAGNDPEFCKRHGLELPESR